MEFITWRDDYNLGDDLIDTHHKIFFEMVRDLVDMQENNKKNLDMLDVTKFLTDYIAMHFTAEEALMERINYPQRTEHQGVHKGFTEKVNEVVKQVEDNPESISLEVLLAITQEWFLKHIIAEDFKMKEWIKTASS